MGMGFGADELVGFDWLGFSAWGGGIMWLVHGWFCDYFKPSKVWKKHVSVKKLLGHYCKFFGSFLEGKKYSPGWVGGWM